MLRQLLCFGVLAASLPCSKTVMAQMHSVEPGISIKLEILEFPRDRYEQVRGTLESVARARGSESGEHNRVTLVGVFQGKEINQWLSDGRCTPSVRSECVTTNRGFKIQDRIPDLENSDSKTRWMGTFEVTSAFVADGEWSIGLKPETEIDIPNSSGVPGLYSGPGPRRLRMRSGQVAVIDHPYDIKTDERPRKRFVEFLPAIGSAARAKRRQADVKRLILVQAQ